MPPLAYQAYDNAPKQVGWKSVAPSGGNIPALILAAGHA